MRTDSPAGLPTDSPAGLLADCTGSGVLLPLLLLERPATESFCSWPPVCNASSRRRYATRCRSLDCCSRARSSASSRSIFSISSMRERRSSSSRTMRSRTEFFTDSCLAPSDRARLRAAAANAERTLSAFAAASASASAFCSCRAAFAASCSCFTAADEPTFWSTTVLCLSCSLRCCSSRSRAWRTRSSCASASFFDSSASLWSLRSSLRRRSSRTSCVFFSVSRTFLRVFSSSARSSRKRLASSRESCSARLRAAVAL
mmetsp:Transcript_46676/g.107878  ORF Transcript_46676/g.107878 Transcript_46676/m.107878 type:complete len:259 (-) Transcript_46676:112-888(-)